MRFRLIPKGSFRVLEYHVRPRGDYMSVTFTNPFYLGVHEVTQAEYERVTGENPSHFRGPDLPVDSVVWPEAVAFCRKLSELEGIEYRLPTEAEWHVACRAGTTTPFCFGAAETIPSDCAWQGSNSDGQTHPVGLKKPNAWGLYDMHGNVSEWCLAAPEQYPMPWWDQASRAERPTSHLSGGAWHGGVFSCDDHRERTLGNRLPTHGFRVAASLP